ncbi:diguanylate cyclase regulator RdcB family protein [Moraxella catarrhalis]|uniref:diguanylate cyclase regulator RdcB family protein n=1 Tax=Moraxella catarrhalis TaxID=480 RepID=UPI00128E508D|nr:diguanylate cyclase regulator RdcB family protein [Moraxella catarrhalis]MPY07779.1 hypothetical protein [Moraxella catarrhalis]
MQLINHKADIETALPYIKDKMMIDFVNGLDTAKAINTQNHRRAANSGFFARNLFLLSGKAQMTQNNVNDHLLTGLEACRDYFKELSYHNQAHAVAISGLKEALSHTQNNMAEIAHFVADFKELVDDRFQELDSRVFRLELKDRANTQRQAVLKNWEAERLSDLSPMAQCFSVLDSLKWGDFGYYVGTLSNHEKEQCLDTLMNEMVVIQKNLLGVSAQRDLPKDTWLTAPTTTKAQALGQAVAYQGDWSWQDPTNYGMVFTATQYPMLDEPEQTKYKNISLPMIDSQRLVRRMSANVFDI